MVSPLIQAAGYLTPPPSRIKHKHSCVQMLAHMEELGVGVGSYSWYLLLLRGFTGSSGGKESTYNTGVPGLIPELGRSLGEGIGYPLQYSWASLVAQTAKNPPAMRESWVQSLD